MKKFRQIINILYKTIGIAVLVALFFAVVHPLLTHFLIPPLSVHSGAEFYLSGKYMKFEDGEQFHSFLNSWNIKDNVNVVNFYHVNHWVRDNPIYGKFLDVFALDILMEADDYAHTKAILLDEEQYGSPSYMDDYQLWDWSVGNTPDTYGIAFLDQEFVVRFLMVTEIHEDKLLPTVFDMHTALEWKRTGDG